MAALPAEEVTTIGQTNFRGQVRAFGIYPDDRRRHVYLIGKTGVGKTTLMENMIRQDIARGKGVALVDPHGDVAENLLDAIPPQRINDVVYFDPADVDYPIAFNVLEAVDPQYKYLVSSGLIGSLKKIWADSWGPRLEYILRNTILALLDYPSSTMLGILRMLGDKNYRRKVVSKIQDPVVKSFWLNEFAGYNERFRSEAISPIQNKVGQFLTSSIIRNIVAQPKSTIDMKDIMDNRKILLINVSKGRIGEDNSSLLGAMLITRLQLAAMDRAKVPEAQRQDFYLYVDEFQNFATESFATILSEARKYRLNLAIAHQYITQMEEPVRDAVFGNAGTIIAFRVGAADAEYLEKEFFPTFSETDLVNLDKYNAYIKLMINGITSKPFSMQTIPPASEVHGQREKVITVSRERYGRRREIVEDKIARWSGVVFTAAASEESRAAVEQHGPESSPREEKRTGGVGRPPRDEQRARVLSELPSPAEAEVALPDVPLGDREPRDEIRDLTSVLAPAREEVVCSRCGRETDVPFTPRSGQPVYCRECLRAVREARGRQSRQLLPHPRPRVFSGPKPPSLP